MKFKKFYFKNVNSTNDIAIKLIKKTNNKFGVIVADKQKKGRGRFGRKWISYKGNLFVSLFFSLEKINLTLKQLTKVNCLLIKKLLSYYYKNKISIKHPNDLFINKRKICGILQEAITKANVNYFIVGVGINLVKSPIVNKYPTISILELTKKNVSKKKIIFDLVSLYENFINKFSRSNLKSIKNL